MPVQVSRARAYRTSSTQSIPHAIWTKVELDAETYDAQNEFDSSSNYRFIAKRAGYYLVNASIRYNSPVSGAQYAIGIYKNGVPVTCSINEGQTYALSTNISDIIYLDAGDYLELWTYHESGAAKNIENASKYTFMSIHKLSD